jgi:hypothetical protein
MIDKRRLDFSIGIDLSSEDEKLLKAIEQKLENCLTHDQSCNEVDTSHEYFFYFIQHLNMYYLYLNERAHSFKLQRSYLTKAVYGDLVNQVKEEEENKKEKAALSESKENFEDVEVETEHDIVDKKVLELFRLHKQQNKALTMFNLTKKNELNVKKCPQAEDTNQIDSTEETTTNETMYFQRDCRFRYQVWSSELVANFLSKLSSNNNYEEKAETKCVKTQKLIDTFEQNDIEVSQNFLIGLCELIVVFNSCSSYCQCSAIVENNNNCSSFDLAKIKAMSGKFLSFLIHKINGNKIDS